MIKPFRMTGGLRVVSTIITTLLRLGLPVGPSVLLSVAGRKSGKIYTIPVELVENNGTSFLVAAFGEVNWVRNLRAAGSAQLTRRRRTETIGVVELEAREAAPILKQFLRESQRVSFIKPYFRVTPQSSLADFEEEALYHPVFRVVSTKGRQEESTGQRYAVQNRRSVSPSRSGGEDKLVRSSDTKKENISCPPKTTRRSFAGFMGRVCITQLSWTNCSPQPTSYTFLATHPFLASSLPNS